MAKSPIPPSRIYSDARINAAQASLIRLQKAALILNAVVLTPRELHHLAAVNTDTAGVFNDLDTDGSIAAPAMHALWTKLAWLAWFHDLKSDEPDENTWVSVLENPALQTPQGKLVLAGASYWKEQDLTDTLAHFGLVLAGLSSLSVFRRVKEAVDFIAATNQPAADFVKWATPAPTAPMIADIKTKLRTRQDDAAWRATLQSVNDALRNERRDALVAYILHHQVPVAGIDTPDKLYQHFLVDVEMDACMQTSRIRQALSTTQLFTNRCLMNLEQSVSPDSINPTHWAWMKRYRVWEANRKIFLYPENWLEPELRDNKSSFFRDLESELLKSDITDELAEDAYLAYLKKLDEVARLRILGAYLEQRTPADQDDDILHVFGCTNGSTRQYYYRRYEYGYWTPWEKIGLKIDGDLLFPVIWKKQLYLFWVNAVVKPKGGDSSESPQTMGGHAWAPAARLSVELNLGWGEYYHGKWTSPKSSELRQPLVITNLATFEPEKLVLAGRTEKPAPDISERLVLTILYMGNLAAFNLVFTSKNSPPIISSGVDPDAFNSLDLFNYHLLWEPAPSSQVDSNSLREPGKSFKVRIVQPAGASASTLDEVLLTKTAQLYDGFNVRPVMHPVENQWEAPLVYSDEHSVLFMNPDESVKTFAQYDGFYWNDNVSVVIPPKAIEIPPLYERPVIKDPIGPVSDVLQSVIHPNYERTISDNKVFVYQGTAFDAHGIASMEARQ